MTLVWIAALVGAVAAALVARAGQERLRSAHAAEKARRGALERELAQLQRAASHLQEEHQFLTHFLNEFPHLARELHSGLSERRIPDVMLNIVNRVFEPQQAMLLVRRRRSADDASRSGQLVVAAQHPEGLAVSGSELAIGRGEIGFAAEVQRTMGRADFDALAPLTRQALREENLQGFEPSLVAPMVFGEQTVGAIAVSRPRGEGPNAKAVLRLIAQLGGQAIHNVSAYAQMKVTADVDGLTLVYNKRHMTQTLAESVFEAQQKQQSLSVFLFDIDNFKHYNDRNGHVAGDRLLQMLARLIQDNTRQDTVIGRFGGEEFLILFKNTPAGRAQKAAENLRALIAAHPFPHAAQQPLGCLSISGGVAEYPKDALDSNALLRAADEALYEGKRQGRNRVRVAQPCYLSDEEPSIGDGLPETV